MLQILKSKNPNLEVDAAYLERLQGLPQSVFKTEIEQLTQSSAATAKALETTGINHGSDFVGLADSLEEIMASIDSIEVSSAAALESTNKVPHQPVNVYSEIQQLLAKEMELYTHLDQIQEIVQIPELSRSCVDSGMYAPAHDIYAFVQRLWTRYPKSSITTRIHRETESIMMDMREILLKTLRESSKMQVLIKTLGLLRKLEPFRSAPPNQLVLQQVFVASRLEFMRSQTRLLSTLEASNSGVYLKRYIEQFREHVGTAISAMSSVFGPTTSASQFSRTCVKELAKTLDTHYPLVTEDKQRVLLQLTYCSYSLGRSGIEFWPLLESSLTEQEWVQAYNTQQALSKAASEREGAVTA